MRTERSVSLAEARNMARFNTHPNIVHVYDFFEENGTAYIVMEFLDEFPISSLLPPTGEKWIRRWLWR